MRRTKMPSRGKPSLASTILAIVAFIAISTPASALPLAPINPQASALATKGDNLFAHPKGAPTSFDSNTVQAKAAYDAALEIDPTNVQALQGRGAIRVLSEKNLAAAIDLGMAEALQPGSNERYSPYPICNPVKPSGVCLRFSNFLTRAIEQVAQSPEDKAARGFKFRSARFASEPEKCDAAARHAIEYGRAFDDSDGDFSIADKVALDAASHAFSECQQINGLRMKSVTTSYALLPIAVASHTAYRSVIEQLCRGSLSRTVCDRVLASQAALETFQKTLMADRDQAIAAMNGRYQAQGGAPGGVDRSLLQGLVAEARVEMVSVNSEPHPARTRIVAGQSISGTLAPGDQESSGGMVLSPDGVTWKPGIVYHDTIEFAAMKGERLRLSTRLQGGGNDAPNLVSSIRSDSGVSIKEMSFFPINIPEHSPIRRASFVIPANGVYSFDIFQPQHLPYVVTLERW